VSPVPHLYGAALVAVVAILCVELSKALLTGRLGQSAYWAFCTYQATLGIDIMRRFALDWYGYLLHFLRLSALTHEQPYPDPLAIPQPLLSFAGLVLALLFGAFSYRRTQRIDGTPA
jgi:hypothetical protein